MNQRRAGWNYKYSEIVGKRKALSESDYGIALLNLIYDTIAQRTFLLRQFYDVFKELDSTLMGKFVECEKKSDVSMRRMWFLYEWMTSTSLNVPDVGQDLPIELVLTDNYHGLHSAPLEERFRLKNNLPGTPALCYLVDKDTGQDSVVAFVGTFWNGLEGTNRDRAIAHILELDTKASWKIENEEIRSNRVALVNAIFRTVEKEPLSKNLIIKVQNAIRMEFPEEGYRKQQNSVATPLNTVVYGPPKPGDVEDLMAAWLHVSIMLLKDRHFPALVAAAISSLAFVTIHPFLDGNGRASRWLLLHIVHAKISQYIPFSIMIAKDKESYVKAIASCQRDIEFEYELRDEGELEVISITGNDVDQYRYLDATPYANHLEYLAWKMEEPIGPVANFMKAWAASEEILAKSFNLEELGDTLIRKVIHAIRLKKTVPSEVNKRLTEDSINAISELWNEIGNREPK